jgi:hypothetical protein
VGVGAGVGVGVGAGVLVAHARPHRTSEQTVRGCPHPQVQTVGC